MLRGVGYGRTISRACFAAALTLGTAAGAAEPLTVTRLPDSEKGLLVSTAFDSAPEAAVNEFSRAVSDAVQAQQKALQANCQGSLKEATSVTARWAWEVRCRYKRY
jgi:hypothetical protein